MTIKIPYLALSVFILFWGNVSAVKIENLHHKQTKNHNQQQRRVELYKCKDSKIGVDTIENVPSYPFYEVLNVSIRQDPFPGCKPGRHSSTKSFTSFLEALNRLNDTFGIQYVDEFINTSWKERKKDFGEFMYQSVEMNGVSISPQGFLNVEDHNYDTDEFCIENYSQEQINGTIYDYNLLEVSYCPYDCDDKLTFCIPKCCPIGQSILYNDLDGATCDLSGNNTWKGFMYNTNGQRVDKLGTSHKYQYFRSVIDCDNKKPPEKNESVEYWYMRDMKLGNESKKKTSFRLNEEGKLEYLGPSRKFEQLKDGLQFCIDGFWKEAEVYTGNEEDQTVILCSGFEEKCFEEDDEWKKNAISAVYMVFLFTASIFYLATTAVYLLLWDTQKVHGWTTASLTISLFFMCASTAMAHTLGLFGGISLRNSYVCKANAIIAHYFYISSFTWLCVVNFDIWSTFRALQRRNEKDLKKLVWYSLVGWGMPLGFIGISITLNELYPERESMILIPEYGDTLCFVAPWAQGAYIYYPLILPIVIILTLTCSTFWNLFGFQRDAAIARTSSSKSDQQLAKLYLKLSLILGTSWSFEVISWLVSSENCQNWAWMIADLYNALSAILIFIFFGLKESNVVSLEDKYPLLKELGLCRCCQKLYGQSSTATRTKSTGITSKDKGSSSSSAAAEDGTAMKKL